MQRIFYSRNLKKLAQVNITKKGDDFKGEFDYVPHTTQQLELLVFCVIY